MVKNVHYTLRIASAMCFIGHGAFGIITKKIWLNYFLVFGIGNNMAYHLMPLLGALDVLIGFSVLFFPARVFLLWLVIWGIVTAALRPLSGEPLPEFFERAGNFGVPLALLILSSPDRTKIRLWFSVIDPEINVSEKTIFRATILLRIVVFLLIAGHGWLNLADKKGLLDQYRAIGFAKPGQVAGIAGTFEVVVAAMILVVPLRPILLALLIWKMVTELFYPHWEIPEWIERGGSYGAILALFLILPRFQRLQRMRINLS